MGEEAANHYSKIRITVWKEVMQSGGKGVLALPNSIRCNMQLICEEMFNRLSLYRHFIYKEPQQFMETKYYLEV